jgi:glutamate carboxypeptidase
MPGKQTGGYLFARPSKRRREQPLQLMVGHCDTVWEIGTIEEMPLEQTREQMKGPGIFDMKAGLTQMAFALQAIRDLNLKTTLCPVALINSDEEIGSRESTPAIRRLAKIAKRAYILEPPLGLEGKLKTARKGLGRFTLLVKGRAAHAGLDPGKGASAIVELSHQIQNLFALNDPQRGITVNVGMIEGGVSPNVVAPQSKAVVDVRVLSLADAEYITHRIHSLKPVLPDTELEIDGAIGRPPMEKTARNRLLWALARTEALKMGLDVEEATAGGGSDGNTTSLYTATLDGLGATGDGAHAAHEFIFVDKLIERTALLTLLLMAPSVG